jgi:hypothetical protein
LLQVAPPDPVIVGTVSLNVILETVSVIPPLTIGSCCAGLPESRPAEHVGSNTGSNPIITRMPAVYAEKVNTIGWAPLLTVNGQVGEPPGLDVIVRPLAADVPVQTEVPLKLIFFMFTGGVLRVAHEIVIDLMCTAAAGLILLKMVQVVLLTPPMSVVLGTGPLCVTMHNEFTAIVTVPFMSVGSVNGGDVVVASAVAVFVRLPVVSVVV